MPALLERYHVPGAVVAYIRDGAVSWTRAFGLANVVSGAPMQPELIFNHGSDGKVLTAWAIMRLVEQGALDLDAPVNRYLQRWRLQSSEFDPDDVTLRRLLSHTAGLTVRGFSDYSPRRALPTLVQMLEGQNQLDGAVKLAWQPGSRFEYSGGGFAILQMVIEDVTGEPFAAFMQREVTGPLGLSSLSWTWTPELTAQAPTPYGWSQEPLEYRQLASHAIGSEVSTVPDFARFVAAAVAGPAGEPAGRGVLQPDTVQQMTSAQPATNGTAGFGYGLGSGGGGRLLMHFGSNPGWNAHFVLSVQRREGFVIATNSIHGQPLNLAVHFLWLDTALGEPAPPDPAPSAGPNLVANLALSLTALLALPLLVAGARLAFQVRAGHRRWTLPVARRAWLPTLPWVLLALAWWYWFYTPWPLPLPTTFPDLWRQPSVDYVLLGLLAWAAFSLLAACLPAARRPIAARSSTPAVSATASLNSS
jgi:CubicO group peptidase (beta-lactamase class C family)